MLFCRIKKGQPVKRFSSNFPSPLTAWQSLLLFPQVCFLFENWDLHITLIVSWLYGHGGGCIALCKLNWVQPNQPVCNKSNPAVKHLSSHINEYCFCLPGWTKDVINLMKNRLWSAFDGALFKNYPYLMMTKWDQWETHKACQSSESILLPPVFISVHYSLNN